MNIKELVLSGKVKIQLSASGYELLFPNTAYHVELRGEGLVLKMSGLHQVQSLEQFEKVLLDGEMIKPLFVQLLEQKDLKQQLDEITLSKEEVEELSDQILQMIKGSIEPVYQAISHADMSKESHSVPIYAFNGHRFAVYQDGECMLGYDQVSKDVTLDGEYIRFGTVLKGRQSELVDGFSEKLKYVVENGQSWHNGAI